MHKIDGLDATPDHRFQDENLAAGVAGTALTAKFLNAVQEELVGLVERAGLTPSDTNNAQVLAALQLLYGSGVSGGALKNRLINGGFRLWQRGTSHAVTNALKYTADRWVCRADLENVGSGTATISRQAFAPGQTDVPGASNYLRWVQNTLATNGQPALIQRIERLERFSGGKVAVSFWARVATGTLTIVLRLFQDPGAGGSALVGVATQSFAVTTTWQKFTAVATLPSLSGATLGTNPNFRVSITHNTGALYTLEVADFQAELADQVSAFDRRPLAIELLLASRYYRKSYAVDHNPGTDGGVAGDARRGVNGSPVCDHEDVGTVAGAEFWYELADRALVPMRTTPTVTWYKPATVGTAGKVTLMRFPGNPSNQDLDVESNLNAADSLTGYPKTNTVNGSPGNASDVIAHWTADAEL